MHPDAIRTALTPTVAELGLSLYDVAMVGTGKARTLQVLVDGPGGEDGSAGVDLEGIAAATRAVSTAIDALDPIAGPYTLEVSSPGLERPLRRKEHFATALGLVVTVKYRDPAGAMQRARGTLVGAGETSCTIDEDGTPVDVDYEEIVAAHTVFEWRAAAKSGPARKTKSKTRKAQARATRA